MPTLGCRPEAERVPAWTQAGYPSQSHGNSLVVWYEVDVVHSNQPRVLHEIIKLPFGAPSVSVLINQWSCLNLIYRVWNFQTRAHKYGGARALSASSVCVHAILPTLPTTLASELTRARTGLRSGNSRNVSHTTQRYNWIMNISESIIGASCIRETIYYSDYSTVDPDKNANLSSVLSCNHARARPS